MQRSYGSRPSFGRNNSGHSRGNSSSGGYFRQGNAGGGSAPRRGMRRGERIDISRFIKKPEAKTEANRVEIKHIFADFGFSHEVNVNLEKRGYITPTPIQDQTIPYIIEGKDLIGLANTGTGKTAAFLLPLIDKIRKDRSQNVLIIAPTRELAQQINEEFRLFAAGLGIYSAVCVGGAPIFKQINDLRRRPNFIIGTPGRLKDLCERHLIRLEHFQNVVLDEVDRMLDMGFIDEIREMLSKLPEVRQSLFFSATLPLKIRDLVKTFLKDPITVSVVSGETAANVDQDIVRVYDSSQKFEQLSSVLKQNDVKKVLIFSETKAEVDKLTVNLIRNGFKTDSIHGDKRQSHRQKALTAFKNNYVNILVATDVAARGLDISDITHVINYTVPQTYDDYIHRIGRTGRGNCSGKALTFVEVR